MNKYILASLTGIAVLAIATPALAYKGNPDVQGPNYTPERHEAMEQVFASGDYQGWHKLMENKAWRLKEVITNEVKFQEFAKAHEAGEDALTQFRVDNGLNGNMGSGSQRGMRDGSGYGRNR